MKPQGVEQEYVNGLQDEVKLLEYELKLLKDKETQEMENFSHFFQFINDGTPINENIIAMKNLYNLTEKELQNKRKEMEDKVINSERTIDLLKRDIEDQNAKQNELTDLVEQKGNDFHKNYIDLMRQHLTEKYTIDQKKGLKDILTAEARAAQKEILEMKRQEERDKLAGPKLQNENKAKETKLKNALADCELEMINLRKNIEYDLDGEHFRKHKQELNDYNIAIHKRVVNAISECKQCETRQLELNFQIEQNKTEKNKDQKEKRYLQNQTQKLRDQVEKLNKQDEEEIDLMIKEKEKETIRKLEIETQAIRDKEVDIYENRINNYERQNSELVQQKMENAQFTNDLEYERDKLQKQLKQLEDDLIKTKTDNDIYEYENNMYEESLEKDKKQKQDLLKSNNDNEKIITDLETRIFQYEKQVIYILVKINTRVEEF